jgi:hypothetical protein
MNADPGEILHGLFSDGLEGSAFRAIREVHGPMRTRWREERVSAAARQPKEFEPPRRRDAERKRQRRKSILLYFDSMTQCSLCVFSSLRLDVSTVQLLCVAAKLR